LICKKYRTGNFSELKELCLNWKRIKNKRRDLGVKLFLKINSGIISLLKKVCKTIYEKDRS
jgi:hypothetical protein